MVKWLFLMVRLWLFMDTDWLMNMLLMDVNGLWWVMMDYEWMMVNDENYGCWWSMNIVDGWWLVNDSWWRWWITVVNCELYVSRYFARKFRMILFMVYICSRDVECFVGSSWRSKEAKNRLILILFNGTFMNIINYFLAG